MSASPTTDSAEEAAIEQLLQSHVPNVPAPDLRDLAKAQARQQRNQRIGVAAFVLLGIVGLAAAFRPDPHVVVIATDPTPSTEATEAPAATETTNPGDSSPGATNPEDSSPGDTDPGDAAPPVAERQYLIPASSQWELKNVSSPIEPGFDNSRQSILFMGRGTNPLDSSFLSIAMTEGLDTIDLIDGPTLFEDVTLADGRTARVALDPLPEPQLQALTLLDGNLISAAGLNITRQELLDALTAATIDGDAVQLAQPPEGLEPVPHSQADSFAHTTLSLEAEPGQTVQIVSHPLPEWAAFYARLSQPEEPATLVDTNSYPTLGLTAITEAQYEPQILVMVDGALHTISRRFYDEADQGDTISGLAEQIGPLELKSESDILAQLGVPTRSEQLATYFEDLPPGSDLSDLQSGGPGLNPFGAQIILGCEWVRHWEESLAAGDLEAAAAALDEISREQTWAPAIIYAELTGRTLQEFFSNALPQARTASTFEESQDTDLRRDQCTSWLGLSATDTEG